MAFSCSFVAGCCKVASTVSNMYRNYVLKRAVKRQCHATSAGFVGGIVASVDLAGVSGILFHPVHPVVVPMF